MRYETDQQFARIHELLDGGDWACAFGQCGTLSHICLQLADLVDDPALIDRACAVARDAGCDLDNATRQWGELANELRRAPRLRSEPRHAPPPRSEPRRRAGQDGVY